MHPTPAIGLDSRFQVRAATPAWRVFNLAAGIAMSSVIFLGIAHSRRLGLDNPQPAMDDIMSIALPSAPPPPPPTEQHVEDSGPAPSSVQLDTAPANSSVRIEAVPVVLDPAAAPVIRAVAVIPTDFAPRVLRDDLDFDSRHVWDPSQVDQKPVVLWRKKPDIPESLLRTIRDPSITLMWVVNTDGSVENLHVEHPVEPTFDGLVTDAVKEWQFTPAVKRGRKVRCWVQDRITIRSADSNPFDLN